MSDNTPKQATPRAELLCRLYNPSFAKTELEHFASRHLQEVERALAAREQEVKELVEALGSIIWLNNNEHPQGGDLVANIAYRQKERNAYNNARCILAALAQHTPAPTTPPGGTAGTDGRG